MYGRLAVHATSGTVAYVEFEGATLFVAGTWQDKVQWCSAPLRAVEFELVAVDRAESRKLKEQVLEIATWIGLVRASASTSEAYQNIPAAVYKISNGRTYAPPNAAAAEMFDAFFQILSQVRSGLSGKDEGGGNPFTGAGGLTALRYVNKIVNDKLAGKRNVSSWCRATQDRGQATSRMATPSPSSTASERP